MKRTLLRTILVAIPLLMGILIYGAIVQNRVLWSVIIIIGVISVIGLVLTAVREAQAPQRGRPSFVRIQLGGVIGTLIAVCGLAFYDQATRGVVAWSKYAALLLPGVLVLLVLVVFRQLRSGQR